jgi:hypothetical protein
MRWPAEQTSTRKEPAAMVCREKILSYDDWLFGYWLLVIGFWLLVFGYWLLVIGYWFLVIGYWFLVFGFWFLVFGFWFLIQGFRVQGSAKSQQPTANKKTLRALRTHGLCVSR